MKSEFAVIGDIHGEIHSLERAIDWISDWPADLIFVGDYVNRGAHSREVLDLLVELKSDLGDRASFLLGNHDLALLDFLNGASPSSLLAHGGLTTLNSYIGSNVSDEPFSQMRNSFPTTHRRFLNELDVCWETPEVVIAHAGIDPTQPASRMRKDLVLGSHPSLFEPRVILPKLVVAGHYVQRDGRPFMSEKFVCVDSGCGAVPGAPLSIVVFPNREVVSI
ncbi:metallophosphoesterase family protein [Microbacterium sp. R86528]|uniref:metallophosphoesterase family protein n=1 Tax=Microbacterium sp. R86528 TaxID=3093864 RepID=UPI0037C75817